MARRTAGLVIAVLLSFGPVAVAHADKSSVRALPKSAPRSSDPLVRVGQVLRRRTDLHGIGGGEAPLRGTITTFPTALRGIGGTYELVYRRARPGASALPYVVQHLKKLPVNLNGDRSAHTGKAFDLILSAVEESDLVFPRQGRAVREAERRIRRGDSFTHRGMTVEFKPLDADVTATWRNLVITVNTNLGSVEVARAVRPGTVLKVRSRWWLPVSFANHHRPPAD